MTLYHDRENNLLFKEYLPFRRRPDGQTEIFGIGIVRVPPPGMREPYIKRIEITSHEAIALAQICSVPIPPEFLPDKTRPHWDGNRRELSFGGRICRRYPRDNAPNQFRLLDEFQAAIWTDAVKSTFKKKRTLSETIDGLNRGLSVDSPIRFHLKGGNAAWREKIVPAFSGD
jgi:hypothetical protein